MHLWIRLGITLALIAGHFVLVAGFLHRQPLFDAHKWHIGLGLLGGGFLLWVVTFLASDKTPRKVQGSENHTGRYRSGDVWGDPHASSPPLFTAGFCGILLMLLGTVTIAATPSTRAIVIVAARSVKGKGPSDRVAREADAAAPDNQKRARAKRPTVPLRLQGIIYTPPKTSAIINGQTVFVGEKLGDGKITAITSESVTLDYDGEEETLRLKPARGL